MTHLLVLLFIDFKITVIGMLKKIGDMMNNFIRKLEFLKTKFWNLKNEIMDSKSSIDVFNCRLDALQERICENGKQISRKYSSGCMMHRELKG